MLHEITWKDYWTFIAITTLTYWLIIVSFFYRHEIVMLTKRKKNNNAARDLATPDHDNDMVLAMQQPLSYQGNDVGI